MAIAFSTAFNSTVKTLTLTVTNYDGNATVDIYYKINSTGTLTPITTTFTAGAVPETIPVYYDATATPTVTITGTEEDVFTDGLYYVYIVPAGTTSTDVEDNYDPYIVMADVSVKCCIVSKIAALDEYDCDNCTRDNEVQRLFFMKLLLDGAEFDANASCGDYTEAETKLLYVTELCDADTDCIKRNCS